MTHLLSRWRGLPWLVSRFVIGLQRVTRTRRIGWARVERLRRHGEKFSFALFHGNALIALAEMRKEGCTALVSKSRDGDLAAALLAQLGYASVRGSSSQGGSQGLRGLLRALTSGSVPVITVDGPRGPAGRVSTGIAGLARLSDSWIVPLAASSTRSLRFSTWDRSCLPLPLSDNFLVFGKPLRVRTGESDEETRGQIEKTLKHLQRRADRIAGRVGP